MNRNPGESNSAGGNSEKQKFKYNRTIPKNSFEDSNTVTCITRKECSVKVRQRMSNKERMFRKEYIYTVRGKPELRSEETKQKKREEPDSQNFLKRFKHFNGEFDPGSG